MRHPPLALSLSTAALAIAALFAFAGCAPVSAPAASPPAAGEFAAPAEEGDTEPGDTTAATQPATLTASLPATAAIAGPGGEAAAKPGALAMLDTPLNLAWQEWRNANAGLEGEALAAAIAASPPLTVTMLFEDAAAATAAAAALPGLGGALIAQTDNTLAARLPTGALEQAGALPGLLIIQTPAGVSPGYGVAPRPAQEAQPAGEISALFTGALPDKEHVQPRFDAALSEALLSASAAGAAPPLTATIVFESEEAAVAASAALPELGAAELGRAGSWLAATAPASAWAQVAELPGVLLVQAPARRPPVAPPFTPPQAAAVSAPQVEVISAGVARSGANLWHTVGITGAGVKVAVIDSFGQDILDAAFAAGEIPTKTLDGPEEPGVTHGVAVAEIIHDMAPAAKLTLVTPSLTTDFCVDFALALDRLAPTHDVISSSFGPAFCPSPGDGSLNPISDAANRARNTHGAFYVQAAGNNAEHHYEAMANPDEDGLHRFSESDNINVLGVWYGDNVFDAYWMEPGSYIAAYLRWNGGWPRSSQDYDLYLVRSTDGRNWEFPLGCFGGPCYSITTQDGATPPYERIEIQVAFPGYYGVMIRKYKADGNHVLDLLTSHAQPPLYHSSPQRSIVGVASNPYAFDIAAANAGSQQLEDYSSQGPTYGPGNEVSGGATQPLLAGYADVETYSMRTFDGFSFTGTSAATPHVAGAVALILDAAPCYTPELVASFLRRQAADGGPTGYDFGYGSGLLRLGPANRAPNCAAWQNLTRRVFLPLVQP